MMRSRGTSPAQLQQASAKKVIAFVSSSRNCEPLPGKARTSGVAHGGPASMSLSGCKAVFSGPPLAPHLSVISNHNVLRLSPLLLLLPDPAPPHEVAAGAPGTWGTLTAAADRLASSTLADAIPRAIQGPLLEEDDDADFQKQLAAAMEASMLSAEADQNRRQHGLPAPKLHDPQPQLAYPVSRSAWTYGGGGYAGDTSSQLLTETPSLLPADPPGYRPLGSSGQLHQPLGAQVPQHPALRHTVSSLSLQDMQHPSSPALASIKAAMQSSAAGAPAAAAATSIRSHPLGPTLQGHHADPISPGPTSTAATASVPCASSASVLTSRLDPRRLAPLVHGSRPAIDVSAPLLSSSPGKHARAPSSLAAQEALQPLVKRSRAASDCGSGPGPAPSLGLGLGLGAGLGGGREAGGLLGRRAGSSSGPLAGAVGVEAGETGGWGAHGAASEALSGRFGGLRSSGGCTLQNGMMLDDIVRTGSPPARPASAASCCSPGDGAGGGGGGGSGMGAHEHLQPSVEHACRLGSGAGFGAGVEVGEGDVRVRAAAAAAATAMRYAMGPEGAAAAAALAVAAHSAPQDGGGRLEGHGESGTAAGTFTEPLAPRSAVGLGSLDRSFSQPLPLELRREQQHSQQRCLAPLPPASRGGSCGTLSVLDLSRPSHLLQHSLQHQHHATHDQPQQLPGAAAEPTAPESLIVEAADRRLLMGQRVWFWVGPGQALLGKVISIDRRSKPLIFNVRLEDSPGAPPGSGEIVMATADCLLPYVDHGAGVMCRLPAGSEGQPCAAPAPASAAEGAGEADGAEGLMGGEQAGSADASMPCVWAWAAMQHCVFDGAVPMAHVHLYGTLPYTLPYERLVPVEDAAEGSGCCAAEPAVAPGLRSGSADLDGVGGLNTCTDIVPLPPAPQLVAW